MHGATKGIAAMLIGLVAGALLGVTAFFAMSQATRLETSAEVYLSDLSSLDMLYNGKNMQDYLAIGKDKIIKNYIESGGPAFCGEISFSGKLISIWKDEGCDPGNEGSLAVNETLRIVFPIVKRYAVKWGLSAGTDKENFCLKVENKLPFGKYLASSCFDSRITEDVDAAISRMFSSYSSGDGTCSCEGLYKVCWTDDEGANFTYAVLGC